MTNYQKERLLFLTKDLPTLMQDQNFYLLTEFRELRLLQQKENFENTGICNHEITTGNDNGESCATCKKPIRGYGNKGTENDCIHDFRRIDKSFAGECIYCQKQNSRFITN